MAKHATYQGVETPGARELAEAMLDAHAQHEWTHWDNLGRYQQRGFCLCGEYSHVVDDHSHESIPGSTAMAYHRAEVILAGMA